MTNDQGSSESSQPKGSVKRVAILYFVWFAATIGLVKLVFDSWLHWLSADDASALAAFLYLGGLTFLSHRVKGVRRSSVLLKGIAVGGAIGAILWATGRLSR